MNIEIMSHYYYYKNRLLGITYLIYNIIMKLNFAMNTQDFCVENAAGFQKSFLKKIIILFIQM